MQAASRRTLLALAGAGIASARAERLAIDTHLEVWTFDRRFPFRHPERPDLKRVPMEAPIENEVAEMDEFGLKYAVLINPRHFGWDNSYIDHCLHRDPKRFVAHGLLDPLQPDPAARLRHWMEERADSRGCASAPSIVPRPRG